MIKNRQEGLTTLHSIWVTVLVTLSFIGWLKICQFFGWFALSEDVNYNLYLLAVFVGTLLSLRVYSRSFSELMRGRWIPAAHITKQQFFRLALLVLATAFVREDIGISRFFLASYLLVAVLVLLLANRFLPLLLCRWIFQASTVPTLFIGDVRAVSQLREWIEGKSDLGVEPIGILTDDPCNEEIGMPRLGSSDELHNVLKTKPVGQVILLDNYLSRERAEAIVAATQKHGCRLQIYNNLEAIYKHPLVVNHEGEYTFYTLTEEPLENPINRAVKRLFDIAFSLPIVAFVLPPLIFTVWYIQRRQAPGCLFYTQPRTGITKRTFNIIKFRTMYDKKQDSEARAKQASTGDSRIYPFGAFLRKTSLDEIPQFINVLLGDMSVAGPRPHLIEHDQKFSIQLKSYYTRHFVKPGITGLAQSKGYRGEVSELALLEKRISYDIEYINTWSILLDVKIVLLTFKQILLPPKSAY